MNLFPSPGWGELIEREGALVLFMMVCLVFPSPGWGELIERIANIQTQLNRIQHEVSIPRLGRVDRKIDGNIYEVTAYKKKFPSPGWGELIESSVDDVSAHVAQELVSIPRLGRVDRKSSLSTT